VPSITKRLPLPAAVLSVAALLSLATLGAAPAGASTTQESIFQADNQVLGNPTGTLQELRSLGVQRVRINVAWGSIAPHATSTHRPKRFSATDPAAYPAAGWAPYDAVVRAAASVGISLDFTLDAPAPLWATGGGAPRGTTGYFRADWNPSAREFGYFVKAVGTRYDGSYRPRGQSTPLPRINFWSIWNEPDYGYDLAPQGVGAHQSTENSPRLYRGLVDAAWGALQATGHRTRTDTILFGELTARGNNAFGTFAEMKPLIFLRALYCVDSSYHALRGSAAAARGCPTTAGGSRNFRRQHPALFGASGVSVHPYEMTTPPNKPTYLRSDGSIGVGRSDSNFADLPELPRLARTLDRLNGVYGSHKHFPVWDTEYGYRTRPPDPHEGVSPATGAAYINWAEYLSYKMARLYSYSQYGLIDPPPPGYFDSGLENPNGTHKPGYDAYRMPLFLPTTSTRSGRKIEIWGGVRPAGYARLDTGQRQSVQIQFQRGSRGSWQTIDTVTITNSKGYIDVHLALPASGAVRLAWSYPAADRLLGSGTIYSRTVSVTVK
jgi:hypothetical protein